MKGRREGPTAPSSLDRLTDAQNNAVCDVVQMQFSFHDRRLCLGRRCLTAPGSRCSFYPQQTFFIRWLTAEETFSFPNVHMMYTTHVRDEKCLFKKSISVLRHQMLDVLNLDGGCRPLAGCQTSQKKKTRKIGIMDREAILSPKQESRAIRSLPATFPLRAAIRHQGVRGRKIHQNSLCSARYTKEPLRIRDGRCVYSRLH